MKRTAIAILNWNGEHFLRQFLPSVITHSDADIYVIDNASSDQSLDLLAASFPQVRIIALNKNFGYAGGYNRGLKEIENEIIVLLNSDVEVTAHWIEPVLNFFDERKDMAACQPKILDYHRKAWFEYAGAAGGFLDKDGYAFCAGRMFYEFEEDLGQYQGNSEVFWASGAALFIRRSAWFEVEGLDEDFFAHMEEIDLCWRLKNRGYAIGACRESVVYHYGGGTLDRTNPFKTYLNFRNNLYLLVKNYRAGSLTLRMLRRMVLDGVAGLRFLLEGNGGYFLAVLKAHGSVYRHIGKMLAKRQNEAAHIQSPNLNGTYRCSVIKHFFVKGKRRFSELEATDFIGN